MTQPIVPSVTYLFPVPPRKPGPDERETRPLTKEPNLVREAQNAPSDAFGFYYGEGGPTFYIDGTVYDRSNVDDLTDEQDPTGFYRRDIQTYGHAYVQLRDCSRLGAFSYFSDEVVQTA